MNRRFSIKEAAEFANLSEVYIRRMIQQGKLPSTLEYIKDTEIRKHFINEDDLAKFRNNTNKRTIRKDGRNKYTLYANSDELRIITEFIKNRNLGVIVEKANKPEDYHKRYIAQKQKKALKRQNKQQS